MHTIRHKGHAIDMRNYLFLLRTYNDVDHILPVMWKFLKEGNRVVVFFWMPYPFREDKRIKYLMGNFEDFVIHYPKALFVFDGFLRKVITKLFFNVIFAQKFLKKEHITKCVFDFSPGPSKKSLGRNKFRDALGYGIVDAKESFLLAAKSMAIETFCLPHGLRANMNADCSIDVREMMEKGNNLDFSSRNLYDHYVVQSDYHREMIIGRGVDPDKCHVWGSARYCREWAELNLGLTDEFLTSAKPDGKTKVVFMLAQWRCNIDKDAVLELCEAIAARNNIYLVVKDHPRKGGRLNNKESENIEKHDGVEIVTDVESPALVRWSDIVINFGSSVGIEVLLQGKVLIEPEYLHTNHTIFQDTGSAVLLNSKQEVLDFIEKYRKEPEGKFIDPDAERRLYEKVVFWPEGKNILDNYYTKISEK